MPVDMHSSIFSTACFVGKTFTVFQTPLIFRKCFFRLKVYAKAAFSILQKFYLEITLFLAAAGFEKY